MARIFYGVMGDAHGHISRSLAVAQEMPQHEFLFAGGGTVREAANAGYSYLEIPMIATIHRQNQVDVPATVAHFLKIAIRSKPIISRLAAAIDAFDPDIILTDYEFFTPLVAKKLGRLCASLDHQHVLTHCVREKIAGQDLNRLLTSSSVRFLFSFADRFLISSFYRLPTVDDRTEVFPPVLRRAVMNHQATDGEHILIYLIPGTLSLLLPLLRADKRRFIVYGANDEKQAEGNILFRKFSTDGFLEDLASCRYVISNGGHSLISESLYYGKPVLCFPIDLLYEQLLNAHYLQRYGFGMYRTGAGLSARLLDDFEGRLEHYRANIEKGRFFGNRQVAERIGELMR